MTERLELPITGMSCASCANRVEKQLNELDGVVATVNYATERATVAFDPAAVTPAALTGAVEAAGYRAELPDTDDGSAALRRRLAVSAALSLPVLLVAMIDPLHFDGWGWFALALATPVVLWGGLPFHQDAWLNLRHCAATMDTLVSVGTLAAYGWSVYALIAGEDTYLETASVVTTFILAGRYFEARAKRRAGDALRSLLELGAKDVTLEDGQVVPIGQLQPGDRFVVRPGEKIATDGEVESGASAIDMSLLTGESVPIEVGPGDAVAGATINAGGRLVVRATRVGDDTALAQIARLVADAQSGKAPVQRLADRISGVFVPVVILLALATLGVWLATGADATDAFTAAVAVLIIACPCALGLATPTALLVGTGRGAQLGLLIKGPEILESTRRIDTVVLDKTGTVTNGRMKLVDVIGDRDALHFAGALESASEHPVGRAIANEVVPEAFTNCPGLGVEGVVDGRDVKVGRPSFVGALTPELEAARAAAEARGQTAVAVAIDGRTTAVLVVADTVKPTSAAAIADLRSLGLRTVLLTGDNAATARFVGNQVGVDEVIAEVLPADKADVVTRLQAEGHVVAMVGDGVNDAPALAVADLGLSIGSGTDVAIEASDLTLVSGDLRGAAQAIRLSRATLRTIKQNLAWAFGYNIAAIPLAAAGLLNPIIAGLAMALSSISVVANALRLRRFG